MASIDSIISLRFRLPKFNMPAAPLLHRRAHLYSLNIDTDVGKKTCCDVYCSLPFLYILSKLCFLQLLIKQR